MGTSRESSSMISIMRSVIAQFDRIHEGGIETDKERVTDTENLIEMRATFLAKLNFISQKLESKGQLIILLDSIDQLITIDYDLEWMIYNLPENIKIIYSVLSESHSKQFDFILLRLKYNIPQANFINMESITFDDCKSKLNE